MERWLSLSVCLLLCLAVGAFGGRWTVPEIPGWYAGLRKPSLTPPNWLFAPVWTLLYILMALAVWRVWQAPLSVARSAALAAFVVQLALNFAWSWIFFRQHAIGAALVEIALLWAAIGVCTLLFLRVSSAAAGLICPYWAWVSFASLLNAGLWRLNPAHANH